MNRISNSSFVYFNYGLADAIRMTASAGFDGIDIWGGRPHAYRDDLRADEIAGLVALMDDLGLAVASFIPAQFRYPTSLCSPSERVRQASVAYIQDAIATAAAFGAPVVSVCPGHSLHGQGQAAAWDALRQSLTVICDRAADVGIRIGLEPADAYETDLMHTAVDALRMVDELGRENLGVVWDSGHGLIAGEDFSEALVTMGPRLLHLHVDDNNGQRDQHLIPGRGVLDWAALAAAMGAAGYAGFVAAELGWDYTLDPQPAATETAAFLRSLEQG